MNDKEKLYMDEDVVLSVENVHKCYGTKEVLNGVNFNARKGKIIGFFGPNASGKSTLVKIINGLTTLDNGKIIVGGEDIGINSKKIISYLPERTYLNDWMKVKDIIDFFDDFYEDFKRGKAIKMFYDMNIDLNSKLKTLSKGTKEKVQLVLVMSREAELYILDEPIAGVDPAARSYIMKSILTNLPESSTLMIVTHLINDIETICDEVIFLNDGKIVIHEDTDVLRQRYSKSIDAIFREEFKC
ncbi:ABC transporter ATP-binding protein [Peptostreptococcus faecalis]|uniref:ABC transporter ATP-binding protein n=1 Tax=Peptostreptococcus faecalis TaxID=2045015 RepID=UPI000C7A3F5B|nr:ABC transporter ATP-binding protein [Peptostreptococcus faecalis]